MLRRSVCAAGQLAPPQATRCLALAGSDRQYPALTGRSGTQRARRPPSRMTVGTATPWQLGALVLVVTIEHGVGTTFPAATDNMSLESVQIGAQEGVSKWSRGLSNF